MIYGREKAATAGGLVQTFVLAGASLALTNITIPLAGGGENFAMLFTIAAVYMVVGGVLMFVVPDQGKKTGGKKVASDAEAPAAEA